MNDDCTLLESSWESRPLCSKYSVLVFMAQGTSLGNGDGPLPPTLWWALGVANESQSEVLGYWPQATSDTHFWSAVGDDLSNRGVNCIGAVLVLGASDADQPDVSWITSSPGGSPRVTVNRSDRPARLQRSKACAVGVARKLEKALAGMVRRHGPFHSTASAGDFVGRELQRLDRQLWTLGSDPVAKIRKTSTRLATQLPA